MRRDVELLSTIDAFAEAAIDESRWNDALRQLASLTGSSYGQLIGIGGPRVIPFNFMSDLPERLTEEFIQIDGGSPLVNPRIAASDAAAALEIVTENDFDAVRQRLTTNDYLDFASRYDIPYGCQTALAKGTDGVVGLAILRTQKEGRTSAEQLQAFMSVAPAVRTAIRIQARLEDQGALLIAEAFDAMSLSAFICDGSGRVRASTAGADGLLSAGWLKVSSGRLVPSEKVETSSLHAAIARCATARSPMMETLTLKSTRASTSLVLDVISMSRKRVAAGRFSQVLVVARQSVLSRNNRLAILMAAFDFTPTEAEIVAAVIDGLSRRQIAAARNVSEATVQTQFKAIFLKAGVRREGELIAAVSQVLGV